MSSTRFGLNDEKLSNIVKGVEAFIAGLLLAFGFTYAFSILSTDISPAVNIGTLVMFVVVLALMFGYRLAKSFSGVMRTSLLMMGSFIMLLFEILVNAMEQELTTINDIGILFVVILLSILLIVHSGIIEEHKKIDEALDFFASRVTWGVITLYITTSYFLPTMILLEEMISSVTLDPVNVILIIITSTATALLLIATLGGLEEDGWFRSKL